MLKYIFDKAKILDNLIILFFGITFFTIPTFSFRGSYSLLTWGFTAVTLSLMVIKILISKKVQIDLIVISLILFAFSALISSLLCFFKAFNFTPIVLVFVIVVCYSYSKETRLSFPLLLSAYFGAVLFLLVFFVKYRTDIISLNFTKRLGSYFGDLNDISTFFGIGFITSIYFLLFGTKRFLIKSLSAILLILFAFAGLLTGSKIFVLISGITLIISIFLFFGKKRWWASIICVAVFALLFVLLFSLPVFSSLTKRIVDFFDLFGEQQNVRSDYSTIFRIYMFEDGIEMFLRKPLFGFGIWGFATYGGLNNGWSHNHISEGLTNFGLVGFLLFHLPLFVSLKSFVFKNDKKPSYYPFLLIVFFLIGMFSISFYTEKIYAFIIGPVFASLYSRTLKVVSLEELFRRKK